MMKNKSNRVFPFLSKVVLVCVPVALLWILIRAINIGAVWQIVSSVNIGVLVLCMALALVNSFVLDASRWQSMMNALGYRLSYMKALKVALYCNGVVGITPAKSGELYKAYYLEKVEGIKYADVLFVSCAAYALNACMLGIFSLCGLIMMMGSGMVQLPFMVVGRLDVKRFFTAGAARMYMLLFLRFMCNRTILFFTLSIWIVEFVNVWILARVIGLPIPFFSVLLYLPIIIIVSHVPITVRGIGVREWLFVFFFARYASAEHIVSLSILYTWCEHIFPQVLALMFSGRSLQKIMQYRQGVCSE